MFVCVFYILPLHEIGMGDNINNMKLNYNFCVVLLRFVVIVGLSPNCVLYFPKDNCQQKQCDTSVFTGKTKNDHGNHAF